ncbi:unnamed protein product [Microthlaspi erraticum]|uniref:Retrotransposon gag domain-containing protein n=1 Tax=Microthlaspi erraticum TaxID=1685480 RepID=A0A6D2HDX3_9BRAS|nr:unnamed protein product [Microthlaspi erraticum]
MSAAPDIDRVMEETRRTPFTDKIANTRIRDTGKIRFPEYSGTTDPKAHITAFRLAITKAHLSDYEKGPGYCRFFAENLTGPALEWFASLKGGSINSFDQLVSVFLKQYSMFIETRATEADLWKLRQGPDEPLCRFIARFKEVKAKIAKLNDAVDIDACKTGCGSPYNSNTTWRSDPPARLTMRCIKQHFLLTQKRTIRAISKSTMLGY